jgi:hypothetical protein
MSVFWLCLEMATPGFRSASGRGGFQSQHVEAASQAPNIPELGSEGKNALE